MFKNMKVGTKIAGGFAIITMLGVVVGIMGWYSANQIVSAGKEAEAAANILDNMAACRQQEKNFIIRKWKKAKGDDKNAEEKLVEEVAALKEKLDAAKEATTNQRHISELTKTEDALAEYESYCHLVRETEHAKQDSLDTCREMARLIQSKCDEGLRQPAKALMKKHITEGRALADLLQNKWRDHLTWMAVVQEAVINGTNADVEVDPRQCEFGKWFYSDERAKMVGDNRELAAQIARWEEPHAKLHQAAEAINNAATKEEKERVYNEQLLPAFNEMKKLYEETRQFVSKEKAEAENKRLLDVADTANRIIKYMLECRKHEKQYVIDGTGWDDLQAELANVRGNQGLAHLKAIVKDVEIQKAVAEVEKALNEYEGAVNGYHKAKTEQDDYLNKMVVSAREVANISATLNKEAQETMSSVAASATMMIIGTLAAVVVLAVILALVITRGITGPLNRIIDNLSSGAEQTSSASAQVSGASQSLAEGASEQAASIEETSSSLEEMASMTKQNAANAQQANTLAQDARAGADKGNEAMQKMTSAIDDIRKSSDETSKIIKTIDEIAFQTNLLALNAAVEAARAGEAGKGFAVVAEEVRNLAQRSAEAAKSTSDLIEESVKNSENGVSIAAEVAKSLENITTAVGKVDELVGEIAAASNEQAQGIEQINVAVTQMDQVTQQNAANAEESAAASEQLNAQAEQLSGMVRELQALVGGAAAIAQNATAAATAPRKKAVNTNATTKPAKAWKPEAKTPPKETPKHSPKPEEVIPMEEEEEVLSKF